MSIIAKNPTMIFWLDNQQNHGTAVNENWGRELLELFSLGAGNYTETDVRECSRAFTGWTFETKIPRAPYGRFPWKFEYRPEDHDDGEKEFLGYKGHFNGEDILDIIVQQPACGKFICRHLYNFFVADEPQVPAWPIESPRDQKAIDTLVETFRDSKFDMTAVLRVLFNSDFFKNARFQHVKSPAEVVVSTLRLVGGHELPMPGYGELSMNTAYMGQDLLNPPSVEGWHTGKEWINSGSLMARINFMAEKIGNTSAPGRAQHRRPPEGQRLAQPRSAGRRLPRPAWARSRSKPTPRSSCSRRPMSGARFRGAAAVRMPPISMSRKCCS